MRLNTTMVGDDILQRELMEMMTASGASVARVGNFVAQSTAQRVKHKITTGPRSGRQYGDHKASAPGEPPADFTGALADSYTYTRMTDRPGSRAYAGSNLRYAQTLEFGGTVYTTAQFGNKPVYIEPRPVLLPAFIEAINAAQGMLKREFEAS